MGNIIDITLYFSLAVPQVVAGGHIYLGAKTAHFGFSPNEYKNVFFIFYSFTFVVLNVHFGKEIFS